MGLTALRSRCGVIGFIPRDAINRPGEKVVIEVLIELREEQSCSVYLTTSVRDLQAKLLEPDVDGLAGFRAWLIHRARLRFILTHPEREPDIERIADMYWICGREHHRAPFLL